MALATWLPVAAHTSGSATSGTFKFGTKTNPQGVAFEVDSRGFIVGGKPVIPVMGEMHYARVPRNEWRRELRKMKVGGITVVATYCFWIHHEPNEGQWDWAGNNNLRTFLQVCRDEQMPVVLRVGPFCHGEVYLGGFPLWLVENAQADAKQFKLRSLAPGFMAAVERLYNEIGRQAKGLLWKDGGPVVGVQIENECRGPWNYFMALKRLAVEAGLDVPFMTRTGWPKLNGKEELGQLLPLFGDYADGFWDRKLSDMPGGYPKAFVMKETRLSDVIATEALGTNQDTRMERGDLKYPYLTCELGGGMMPSYHRRINISGNEAFPLAVCKLGSGSNLPGYYMYHGGANPYNAAHTMGECQNSLTTNYNDLPHITYDFQAPLGEMGQPLATAFHQTRWLHQFLADWGEELSRMDVDSLSDHYARRGCFVFRNNYVRIIHEEGGASVTPLGMRWQGMTISSTSIQPFAKADGGLYFITVKGSDSHTLTVNGQDYTLTPDKATTINGHSFTLLSPRRAETAFVIDGKMHYAQHGGILYPADGGITEEVWQHAPLRIGHKQTRKAAAPRTVALGRNNVAEQPADKDFQKGAAIYRLNLSALKGRNTDNLFIEIAYQGDCARVMADGVLVEDNFWNGKPMLVRASQLEGKKVELLILPLGKDAPIYLQAQQKALLNQAGSNGLLKLDAIHVMERKDYRL